LRLSTAHVLSLQPFGSLYALELDRFAFIQCAIAIFLNNRIMYEYIFTRAALNEAVSLCAIKPLYRSFFFHDLLLSHLAKNLVKSPGTRNTAEFQVQSRNRPNNKSGVRHLFIPHDHTGRVAEKTLDSGLEAAPTADCTSTPCTAAA